MSGCVRTGLEKSCRASELPYGQELLREDRNEGSGVPGNIDELHAVFGKPGSDVREFLRSTALSAMVCDAPPIGHFV